MLALPLDEARARLEQAGFVVDVVETTAPRRKLTGDLRVLAMRTRSGRVTLIAARGPDLAALNGGG